MGALTETRTQVLGLEHFEAPAGEKPLLRISTAGSVDDGKSTLIGRLLYDSKQVWEDHLDEIGRSKVNRASRGLDLSLLTDGLRAEREQGITIDVAYRYFSTPRRKFIVADTPGHEQYTRNMATGASTAEAAVILIDARKGLLAQSHRHAFIAWLLGVRRLVFAVNKMDLVEFSRETFEGIVRQAQTLLKHLEGAVADFVPVSALDGDNVVSKSERTPWYEGPHLLDLIETLEAPAAPAAFRFPVQLVIRPHLDFRGYAGQVVSGRVRVGDEVVALPSGRQTKVKRIVTFDGDLAEAFAPLSVNIELEDELDVARGDVIAHVPSQPKLARKVESTVVWMNEHRLEPGTTWLLQQGPRTLPARVTRIVHRWDVERLEAGEAAALGLNDLGRVEIETAEPLVFDSYRENRATGGFVLIDPVTNLTMAAGMIERAAAQSGKQKRALVFRSGEMTAAERAALFGHHAAHVDLSSRPALAPLVERTLLESHWHAIVRKSPDLALEPLLAAGLIVVDTVAADAKGIDGADLSSNDDHAALEMVERMRRAGVFLDHDAVQPGEGI